MDAQPALPWRLGARGRWWFDLTLAGGLFVVCVLGHVVTGQPTAALLTAAQILPLVWRRRCCSSR